MEEVYKDIEGYEGLYQVSNKGNVKSLVNHNGVSIEKLLKPSINSNGYLKVRLFKNKTSKYLYVHRLVAKSFIENNNNLPCINHKDECKTNNVVENLEWCSYKYNLNFGTRNSRARKALSKQVYQYTKDGELIAVFESTREAQRQGFHQCAVANCCNGKRKTHKGYIWSYKPIE